MNRPETPSAATPFLDLTTPHIELEEELVAAFREALRSGAFIGGAAVTSFERSFAAFCGTACSAGAASGTDALRFALIASGVRPGDAVVTVANTFIATTEAITQAGAHPVFVDIDEGTCNMDPEALAEYLEARCDLTGSAPVDRATARPVTAVVPVHLYGRTAEMDPILDTASRYGLKVIEDACQAHGAEYHSKARGCWRRAGSMGIAAAFSFYPGKNLGACGEAGAATTDDASVDSAIRMLRDHGQAEKYYHEIEGYNGRLDAIQAAILSIKLRRLEGWNAARRAAAAAYQELLGGSDDIVLPPLDEGHRPVWHLYVIRVEDRDALREHLGRHGVSTGLHYPLPLHLQRAYTRLGCKIGDLPATERVSSEILSLPMYPGITRAQQERISSLILDYTAKG